VPKDYNVDLVEVLLRFSNGAVTLKNAGQSVFDDLSCFAFTNEPNATAAHMTSPLAFWTRHLITCSPGQPASRGRSCLIALDYIRENRDIVIYNH
jgi:hypothetical protein